MSLNPDEFKSNKPSKPDIPKSTFIQDMNMDSDDEPSFEKNMPTRNKRDIKEQEKLQIMNELKHDFHHKDDEEEKKTHHNHHNNRFHPPQNFPVPSDFSLKNHAGERMDSTIVQQDQQSNMQMPKHDFFAGFRNLSAISNNDNIPFVNPFSSTSEIGQNFGQRKFDNPMPFNMPTHRTQNSQAQFAMNAFDQKHDNKNEFNMYQAQESRDMKMQQQNSLFLTRNESQNNMM